MEKHEITIGKVNFSKRLSQPSGIDDNGDAWYVCVPRIDNELQVDYLDRQGRRHHQCEDECWFSRPSTCCIVINMFLRSPSEEQDMQELTNPFFADAMGD